MISKRKGPQHCHPVLRAGAVTTVLAAVLWAVLAAGPGAGLGVGFGAALGVRDAAAQTPPSVRVVSDASGERIQVDGSDFMVFGMNWDVSPTGENYLYDFWGQPDDIITEMVLRDSLNDNGYRTKRVNIAGEIM